MIIWERGPRGGWHVIDDRLAHFDMLRRRVYYGYTKREAQAAHAQFMRELVAARRKENART